MLETSIPLQFEELPSEVQEHYQSLNGDEVLTKLNQFCDLFKREDETIRMGFDSLSNGWKFLADSGDIHPITREYLKLIIEKHGIEDKLLTTYWDCEDELVIEPIPLEKARKLLYEWEKTTPIDREILTNALDDASENLWGLSDPENPVIKEWVGKDWMPNYLKSTNI